MTLKNSLVLLRIPFSLYLMPVFLFALSQASNIDPFSALVTFFIIHLLVYPSSNGYNSYVDRDEGSIGGLEHPPAAGKDLFYLTLALDIIAAVVSFLLVNTLFAICIMIYILASRAYSAPWPRLKKRTLAGFLTVVIFQGGFTYYMAMLGICRQLHGPAPGLWLAMLAASLQIAGAYPLTQIYQHQQDLKDGVKSISYKLGYQGTFIFTAIMFFCCNILYFLYFSQQNDLQSFYLLQVFFVPVLVYFTRWFILVKKDQRYADFKHTMLMNKVASLSMSSCFIVIFIFRLLK